MTILLDILASLVAAFLGALVGSWFWTFHLGFRWLRRLLVDEAALRAFWILTFKPHGGIGAMIRQEGLQFTETTALQCSITSRVEIEMFVRMRRCCIVVMAVVLVASLAAAEYMSIAIPVCCAAGFAFSVRLRNDGYAMSSLAVLFRAVRIWMEADRPSIDETGGHWMRGIVRVLDENEAVQRTGRSAAA